MELLVGLLHQFAEAYGPLVLILEDLHFFDSFSWKLLGNALGDLLSRVLFVCTFRWGGGARVCVCVEGGG